MRLTHRGGIVVVLGTTQTVAWASSFYLPAILAEPMASDLGIATPTIFAAFSFALLISALLGPYAGRAIDRLGGRPVLIATNVLFALGLIWLGCVHGVAGLFAAWALLGVGLGSGLYEAAFAALVALYGRGSRNAISGITLIAGFASTVGWPLSSYLELHIGWRGACFAWAGLHLFLALPLNSLLPSAAPVESRPAQQQELQSIASPREVLRNTILLAIVFAIVQFVSTALAAHLPRLLMTTGVTLAAAVAAGSLLGPAQVGARLLEFSFQRRIHPMFSARVAALAHPLAAVILLTLGAPFASVFVLLHGAGNGIMTIAKGTLPLVLFGPQGYGTKQGVLMVPGRIAQALAPWLFGLCLDRWQTGALWVSTGLWVIGFILLLALRAAKAQPAPAAAATTP
jgi:predicted MFS family arabinose efflux permease